MSTAFLAAAVCGVIVLAIIKRDAPAYAVLAECAVVAVLIIAAAPQLKSLVESLTELSAAAQSATGVLKIMLKSFAVLGAGEICADICRDNSQTAVASAVGFCSKLAALVCAMPLLSAVFETSLAFLNK